LKGERWFAIVGIEKPLFAFFGCSIQSHEVRHHVVVKISNTSVRQDLEKIT
jgi:hypothetical protein